MYLNEYSCFCQTPAAAAAAAGSSPKLVRETRRAGQRTMPASAAHVQRVVIGKLHLSDVCRNEEHATLVDSASDRTMETPSVGLGRRGIGRGAVQGGMVVAENRFWN